jgi:hypothetical protein
MEFTGSSPVPLPENSLTRQIGRTYQLALRSDKKKRLPGGSGAACYVARAKNFYCVGRISCENPMVLTERNEGVLGGKQAGPSVKFVSKL